MTSFLQAKVAATDSAPRQSVYHVTSSLLATQASRMGDVRLKQHISEVLAAYHPFWLRLGLEIVVGKAVPCADGSASRLHRSRAELEAFAREHFLNDADLALQRAGNRALGTLHGDAYWVQGTLSTCCLAPLIGSLASDATAIFMQQLFERGSTSAA